MNEVVVGDDQAPKHPWGTPMPMEPWRESRRVLAAIAFPYGSERTLWELRERVRREEQFARETEDPSYRDMHLKVAEAYRVAIMRRLQRSP